MLKLNKRELAILTDIRKAGLMLVGPLYQPTKTIQGLLAKNAIEEIPGLIDGFPQGYRTAAQKERA